MDKEIPLKERRRRKMIRWGRMGAIALVLIVLVVWFAAASRTSVSMKTLRVGTADTGTIETTVSASGRVAPGIEEIVLSPISSKIVEVYHRAGDLVEAGEPLLRLDLTNVQTQYDQLLDEKRMRELQLEQVRINTESALREAQMRLEIKEMAVNRLAMELRNERYLDSIGSGTGDNVRRALTAYETGRLELEQMRQALVDDRAVKASDLRVKQLDMEIFLRKLAEAERTLVDAQIRSPRRAVVTQISTGIGSQVGQGSQVAIVSELDHYKLDCEVADSYGDRISAGAPVAIKIGKTVIDGFITDFSPVSRSGVLTFTVRPVDDADPHLRSGLRADVYVKTNVIDDAVRIPNGTYFAAGPGNYDLFVLSSDGKTLERRTINLGQSNYEFVEVLSGLAPGEQVVISDMTPYKTSKSLTVK